MKRNSILLLLGLWVAVSGYPQNTFNKIYLPGTTYRGALLISLHENPGVGYISYGQDVISKNLVVLKTNLQGDSITSDAYVYQSPGKAAALQAGDKALIPGDSSLYMTGILIDSTSGTAQLRSFLTKFDRNGDMCWLKEYHFDSTEGGFSVQLQHDGNLVITGTAYLYPGPVYAAYLMKTDTSGNVIWRRTYSGSQRWFGYNSCPTWDGGYLVSALRVVLPNWDPQHPVLIKTDSLGNMEWSRFYFQNRFVGAGLIYAVNPDRYVLVGGAGNFFNQPVAIRGLDTLGNIIWQDSFPGISTEAIDGPALFRRNGNMIAVTSDNGHDILRYFEVNPYTGEVIAIRSFASPEPSPNYNYLFSQALECTDGSLLLGGVNGNGAGTSYYWLAKTDSSGCLVPFCENLGREEENGEEPLMVWPNPGGDNIWIRCAKTGMKARLYDMRGAVLLQMDMKTQQVEADVSFISAGIYYWMCSDDAGNVFTRKWVKGE